MGLHEAREKINMSFYPEPFEDGTCLEGKKVEQFSIFGKEGKIPIFHRQKNARHFSLREGRFPDFNVFE